MRQSKGEFLQKAPSVQPAYTQSHKLRPRPRRPQEAKFSTFSMVRASTLWPGVPLRPALP